MEKYIKSSDLAEVIAELGTDALDYADKLTVDMCISKGFNGEACMEVVIRDSQYVRIVEQKYVIVPGTMSPMEVSDETLHAALEKIEEAERAESMTTEETPSNNE